MIHDPRLRLAIRDALQEQLGAHGMTQILLADADVVLDAIDAATDEQGNRIAWVAPWEATQPMLKAAKHPLTPLLRSGQDWVPNSHKHALRYRWMRDACLEERTRTSDQERKDDVPEPTR